MVLHIYMVFPGDVGDQLDSWLPSACGAYEAGSEPSWIDVIYIWVIGVILSVINISLCFLDLTLVVFHTYLCIRQITTYEYITGKVSKRKKEQKEKNKERSFREPERGSAHYVPHPPPPRASSNLQCEPLRGGHVLAQEVDLVD